MKLDCYNIPVWGFGIVAVFVIGVLVLGIILGVAGSSANSTNITKLNLDCIREFYSDSANEGYAEEDLAKFCNSTR